MGKGSRTQDSGKAAESAQPEQLGTPARARDSNSAATWMPIASLKPWARNPRLNDGEPVRKVMQSIKRFGWGAVVLARADGLEVVAGHTRLKAVEALGVEYANAADRERATWHPEAVRVATLREVPVRLGDWSEHDAHLLALADNRIAEAAEWDLPLLQDVLGGFDLPDVDLAGWSSADLAGMADDFGDVGGVDAPDMPDGAKEPFQQMTFTLHDEQAATVREAIAKATAAGDFDGENANANGNALARIAESYNG